MLKNIAQPDRSHVTLWHMRIACLIPKATNAHPEYVILLLFQCQSGHANAPQYYVTSTFYFVQVWNLSFFNIRAQTEDVEERVLSDVLVDNS